MQRTQRQTRRRRGGKHIYQGFVHTFFPLIPPDKYFENHPEWFSEIDGKRQQGRTQLCLTNDQMRQELVKESQGLVAEESGRHDRVGIAE